MDPQTSSANPREGGVTGPRPRGRPPLRGVARTGHLTLRIGQDELANLKRNAKGKKLSVSPFVIAILEEAGALAPPRRKPKG